MNLSTSNFKNELKVMAVVCAIIGLLEFRQRSQPARAGTEQALLQKFPLLADHLATVRGTGVILLGNSLTQVGYDMPMLQTEIEARGRGDIHVEKIALTGSSPIEWYHNYARCFALRDKSPAVVVINMSPSGIADALPAGYRVGWLANETRWDDVPEILFADLRDVEVGGQYLQARLSPLYADRWDVRIGIVYKLDHALWQGMKWVNTGQIASNSAANATRPPQSYSLLNRMLDLAGTHHSRVVLVAMPARETYTIDPVMRQTLAKGGAEFIDCRNIPGLLADDFEDGWHLNSLGATKFTKHIAKVFAAF